MKSNEEFKKECTLIHKGKYIYDEVEYKGSKEKVCIICPIHGKFWQEANSHLKGCGCPECNGIKKKSTDEFIKESKRIFGDAYTYDKTLYKNNATNVCITCKKHGDFYVTPKNHLHNIGCPECSNLKRYSNREYIDKAISIYGDLYDYSKTDYKNARSKITVTCKKHGDFTVRPSRHLKGIGCPICSSESIINKKFSKFVEEANSVHNFKYSYDESDYKNSKEKIRIICPIHGEFEQTPSAHLNGQGCPKCGNEKIAKKNRLGKDEVIKRFNRIYEGKYSYEKWSDEYKNIDCIIPIVCRKHGLFFKTIHSHLIGQGCPKCKSSILENSIRDFLTKNNIQFEEQKKFDWLKYNEKGYMKLDFYLPKHKIAIECQGGQHYMPINLFGGEDGFKYQVKRDTAKFDKCKENDINVIYFSDRKYSVNVITNKDELLNEIKKNEDNGDI